MLASSQVSRLAPRSRWVLRGRWSDNWESIREYLGGGQGEVKQFLRKRDGQEGFLKTIRNSQKNDPERRGRFFREASAYDTRVAPNPNYAPRLGSRSLGC